jgi:hypothetical protein
MEPGTRRRMRAGFGRNYATLPIRGGQQAPLRSGWRPATDELWVANSEPMNLFRFEPQLRRNFSRHRLTKLSLGGAPTPVVHDLNAGVDHPLLPNEAAKAVALAQLSGLAFNSGGSRAWVTPFDSDRLAARTRFSRSGQGSRGGSKSSRLKPGGCLKTVECGFQATSAADLT